MIDACSALCRLPLFSLLSVSWLNDWLKSAELQAFEPGETIFAIGSEGTHVFLIRSGKVRILRPGKDGREFSMGTLGPNQVFGEYALLAPGLNTATCRGAEAGRLLRIPLPPLRERVGQLLLGRSRLKNWLRLHYLLAHLRDHPSLGFMSATSFLPLLERFEPVRFLAGNTIQAEGFHDDRWFVIQNGRASVAGQADDDQQRELGPGDCFGEAALLGPAGVPTVLALAEVQCHMLRRSLLERPNEPGKSLSLQTVLPETKTAPRCHEWVAQADRNDCGVAALAMVARSLGRHHSLSDLRAQMRVEEHGTSLQELQRTASRLGLGTQAVRIGLDHIGGVRLPAIAHLNDGHYVVLFEVNVGHLIIGDPATGVGTWPLASLQDNWSGQLLLTAPANEPAT
jgi:CRP-like cAMP-binding protein